MLLDKSQELGDGVFYGKKPVFSVRRRTKFLLTLLSAVIGACGKFLFVGDVITFLSSIPLTPLAFKTNIWSLTSKPGVKMPARGQLVDVRP